MPTYSDLPNPQSVGGKIYFTLPGPGTALVRRKAGNGYVASDPVQAVVPAATILAPGSTLSPTMFIHNASLTGTAGQAISLQGDFDAGKVVYLAYGSASGATAIPLALVQSAGQVTCRLPALLPTNLCQLWVGDANSRSASVYLNRAWGQFYDSPEIVAGSTVRLFGRNLQLTSGTPTVRFVQQDSTGISLAGTVSNPDATTLGVSACVTLSVPAGVVAGKTYDVYYSNGLGDSLGEVKCEQSLLAIAKVANPLGIPVGWAHRFDFLGNVVNVKTDSRLDVKAVGDGVTDDRAAFQQAISIAANSTVNGVTGGVVYVPDGTYKWLPGGYGGVEMGSRTLLLGSEKDKVKILYGFGSTGGGQVIHSNAGNTLLGVMNLTFEDATNGSNWSSGAFNSNSYVVCKGVRWTQKKSQFVDLRDCNKVCFTGCVMTQDQTDTSGNFGPVYFNGTKNLHCTYNNITFAVDGINFGYSRGGNGYLENAVVENNTFARDPNYQWTDPGIINHDVILNYGLNVYVGKNNLKQKALLPGNTRHDGNDGETIIVEQGTGSGNLDAEVGTVSSATATTLVDTTKNWAAIREWRTGVYIANGKGKGQWRAIASRSGNTTTFSKPWDIVPDNTSRYAVFPWAADRLIIYGNQLADNQRGIMLNYAATRHALIANNTLVNNGSIDIVTTQIANGDYSGVTAFYPVAGVDIIANNVTDGEDGSFIGVTFTQTIYNRAFGMASTGVRMLRNKLTATSTPNKRANSDDSGGRPCGYINDVQFFTNGPAFQEEGIEIHLGNVWQGNEAINCEQFGYVSSGAVNTLIDAPANTNSGALSTNTRGLGNALRTVQIAATSTQPAPTTPVSPYSFASNAIKAVPNVTYEGPLNVTDSLAVNGVITIQDRNFKSTATGTFCLTISTSLPVVINRCTLVGPSHLIYSTADNADVTVTNCYGYGLTPTTDEYPARRCFIVFYSGKKLVAERNYFQYTKGIYCYIKGSNYVSGGGKITVRYNTVRNITGRNNQATPSATTSIASFFQCNEYYGAANVEVAWNQVLNEPDLSAVGDGINFYRSGGTAASPASVHDNYYQGSYPVPATDKAFDGSGFTTDGRADDTASTAAAYITLRNNQFVSICNGGINVAAGHDIVIDSNRVVTCGYLDDGRLTQKRSAAIAHFNFYSQGAGVFGNNTITGNVMGFVNSDSGQVKNLYEIAPIATKSGNIDLAAPITLAMEYAEYQSWQQKLATNNIILGPQ